MISNIHIGNFKSLADFDMPMSKLTVLIGLNGAGKTTILQAFDFLSQIMQGKIQSWLDNREWVSTDLNSKLRTERNIFLRVHFESRMMWSGSFNHKAMACSREWVTNPVYNQYRRNSNHHTPPLFFDMRDGNYRIAGNDKKEITFDYEGSILSQLKEKTLPAELITIRDDLRNIRSLELLAPHLMRRKSRDSAEDVGSGGEKLSAYLSSLKGEDKVVMLELLRTFYPKVVDIKANAIKGGWKRLAIVEEFNGKRIETEARHINDGLLRIMAILAQTRIDRSLLIFDEIENGVNPELVEKLMDLLIQSKQQIIVTTHSPMILNFLEDEIAREAVQFVYKNRRGETRVKRFFDIPRINAKLAVMGPGEAFIDTDLLALTEECIAIDEEKERQEYAEELASSMADTEQD